MPKDFFIPIWPEVPRSFPKVLRKDTEGFQNIEKTCRNIPILRIPLSGILRVPSEQQVLVRTKAEHSYNIKQIRNTSISNVGLYT